MINNYTFRDEIDCLLLLYSKLQLIERLNQLNEKLTNLQFRVCFLLFFLSKEIISKRINYFKKVASIVTISKKN